MQKTTKNSSLHSAKREKNDEFYTQLADIENECRHYTQHFQGKTILCNCDDPRVSNFFYYFYAQFVHLKLKKLIAVCYKNLNPDFFSQHKDERAVYCIYDGKGRKDDVIDSDEFIKRNEWGILKGDGDFRSNECIELLKQADIVVTNPPFSLFREYIAQLIEYDKKFLVIGSMNAITYKEIAKLFKENKIWLGNGFSAGNAYFKVLPDDTDYAEGVYDSETGLVKFRNVHWFTNLDLKKRHESLVLWKHYSPKDYPTYDNYNAIEVSKTVEIPMDYDGAMGVPISFLDRYNPEQFEIVGCDYDVKQGLLPELVNPNWKGQIDRGYVNGKRLYSRIFIRRIKGATQ